MRLRGSMAQVQDDPSFTNHRLSQWVNSIQYTTNQYEAGDGGGQQLESKVKAVKGTYVEPNKKIVSAGEYSMGTV